MANVIQIKRGKENENTHAPDDNALKEYELGFGTDRKRLFIGLKEGQLETDPVKAIPIAMDLTNGLPIEFGGTGAIDKDTAFKNVVRGGGEVVGPLSLVNEEGKMAYLVLNEDYSYGTADPNVTKPMEKPPTGHLYFKLIEE